MKREHLSIGGREVRIGREARPCLAPGERGRAPVRRAARERTAEAEPKGRRRAVIGGRCHLWPRGDSEGSKAGVGERAAGRAIGGAAGSGAAWRGARMPAGALPPRPRLAQTATTQGAGHVPVRSGAWGADGGRAEEAGKGRSGAGRECALVPAPALPVALRAATQGVGAGLAAELVAAGVVQRGRGGTQADRSGASERGQREQVGAAGREGGCGRGAPALLVRREGVGERFPGAGVPGWGVPGLWGGPGLAQVPVR